MCSAQGIRPTANLHGIATTTFSENRLLKDGQHKGSNGILKPACLGRLDHLLCASWQCQLWERSLRVSARKPFSVSNLPSTQGSSKSISLPSSSSLLLPNAENSSYLGLGCQSLQNRTGRQCLSQQLPAISPQKQAGNGIR